MRSTLAAVVLLGAAAAFSIACTSSRPVEDGTYCPARACEVVRYSVDPKLAPDRPTIEEGLRIWERGTGGRVCFREGGSSLVFRHASTREEADPRKRAGTDWIGMADGRDLWLLRSEIANLRSLVVHETGHWLGLSVRHNKKDFHATDSRSCMTASVSAACVDGGELPEIDRRAFCALHGCRCF